MPLIEDHILVGDLHTSCLIDRDGTAAWLCLPTFESPAVFASLLGSDEHGCWQLAPQGDVAVSTRRYMADSLVAETTWSLGDATVRVIDFMPPRSLHSPGQPQLIRIVEGVTGCMHMVSRLRLRFDYGQQTPRRKRIRQAFGTTRGLAVVGPDAVWLDSDVETSDLPDGTTRADFVVRAGESVAFALTWQDSCLAPPERPQPVQALANTLAFWDSWAARCTYRGPYREAVVRSLITLKALTYAPTGAIVAAPTTSLPEEIGGGRNWDYRYSWLRDSALTLTCLLRTGYREEADAWRQWLLRAVAGDPERLQIMYRISGRRDLPERELNLPGYEGSRPVREGNGAAGQLQLDTFGEVIETLFLAHQTGLDHDDDAYQLQVDLTCSLETQWRSPDEGIWEGRGHRQHFVHSKVMCWVAFDRMIQHAQDRGDTRHLQRWQRERDAIHAEVCERGFDATRNTFTRYYGSASLDASLLLLPLMGFLPPTDLRVIGTVEAVQRELQAPGGLLLRYPTDGSRIGEDGLSGDEGAFLACSFWLVEALVMIGRRDEARVFFEYLLTLRNDVGLLAEEYDSRQGRQLGNFPQGFSHLTLTSAALALASPISDLPRDEALLLSEAATPPVLVGAGAPTGGEL